MTRNIFFIALVSTAVISLSSCSRQFDEFPVNPNRPVNVPPNLVFKALAAGLITDEPWSIRANQFDVCNYNYYGDNRYDWGGAEWNYLTLKDAVKMEEEAKRQGLDPLNEYAIMGKFFRAFFIYRMSSLTGDLPVSEALKGADTSQPAYDTQKAAFQQVLTWLEEANAEMTTLVEQSGDEAIDGDIYFTTRSAWRKVFNTFRLRVLISLSKKEADADLNVKQSFAAILADPVRYPIMESPADNLQFIYNQFNKYPSNPDNLGFDATRYNMAATYLNNLVDLKDPRAFITAEPATQQLAAGKTPADITAYNGASSGEDLAEMSSKMSDATEAAYSVRSRSRYYNGYAPEPGIIVGYPEMCFNIAEAMNRGWAMGDAEEWYKNGIRASMAFYGIPVDAPGEVEKVYPFDDPASVTYNIPFDFDGSYYPQTSVKYAGNNAAGLEQILLQKYLAFFQNSGWEPYFNWRRTRVPEFLTGIGTGNSGRIPLRFQYPDNERVTNEANWLEALNRQFGSTDDDINSEMWLIK